MGTERKDSGLAKLGPARSAARRLKEKYGNAFEFEWLPPYAPELNPVEQVWNHTKYADLANFIPEDVSDLEDHVIESFEKTKSAKDLLQSCFDKAQLIL
jgi:putative transposase